MWKHKQMKRTAAFILGMYALFPAADVLADSDGAVGPTVRASHVAIEIEPGGDGFAERIAGLLRERILRRSQVSVEVTSKTAPGAELRVAIGRRAASAGRFKLLVQRHGVMLPGVARVAPEGYAVKLVQTDGGPLLIAEGADARGLLYAAGEILRRIEYGLDCVSLSPVDVSTAPAYRFRGSSANQGGTMRAITGARGWTAKEWQDYFLDYALAGANIGYAGGSQFEFLKQFNLMTVGGCRPNQFRGDIPEDWKAGGLERWEGTDWVCPSVPDARQALIEQWD